MPQSSEPKKSETDTQTPNFINQKAVDFEIQSVTVKGSLFKVGDSIEFEHDHANKFRRRGIIRGFKVFICESVVRHIQPTGENEAAMTTLTEVIGLVECYGKQMYNASIGDAARIDDIDVKRKEDFFKR
jgi:hypothetical protein